MIIKYCEEILRCLREAKAEYSNRILTGVVKTMEEFRELKGILKGISDSEEIVKELYRKMYEPEYKE